MQRAGRRLVASLTVVAFASCAVLGRSARADDDAPAKAPPPTYATPPQQPAPTSPPPQYPPQAYPPGTYPQQAYPPGTYPQQPYPPGTYPPGTYPPGAYPGYPLARPAPLRYKTVERRRMGLAIAGACVLGGLWSFSAVGGYVDNNKLGYLVPIIGPLFQWNGGNETGDRFQNAGLLLLTFAQAAGAGMLIAGLLTRQKVQVPDTGVTLLPALVPGGAGLAAAGTF